jgi:hypothetical protein
VQCSLFPPGDRKSSRHLDTNVFALVIGINKYEHWTRLKGAVKDANDITNFLKESLSVPENHITKLLDGDAKKDRIIKELVSLSTNRNINKDDAILIYFAGHGSFCAAPEGWDSRDLQIEMICPVDISLPNVAQPTTTGIPDILLNVLISELAEKKGDNIVRSLHDSVTETAYMDLPIMADRYFRLLSFLQRNP